MKLLRKTKKNNKTTKKQNKFKKKTRKNKKTTKKNSKNKKIYKGGTLDDSFLRCYDANLAKIQAAIRAFSGTHAIDPAIAEQFISNQISPVRRQAAKDLIDNTIYISLEEVASIIEQLIVRLYTENNLNADENIYIYSGLPEKSFYFMSVLALYYIRQNGYKEPQFIKELNPEIIGSIGINPIIILDDVSYSGSQLSTMLNKIYYKTVIKDKKPVPKFFILLIALNDFSKYKLSRVPIKATGPTFYDFTLSPFNLLYLPERLYTSLTYKLGFERYFYLHTFFSPFTPESPNISLYLDHKIADEVSTFTTSLTYGPIIPSNYNYDNIFDVFYLGGALQIFPYYFEFSKANPHMFLSIFEEFKTNNPDFFVQNPTISNLKNNREIENINNYLRAKLKTIDVIDVEISEPGIKFYPFINTCKDKPELLNVITDHEVINFDYGLFLIPKECIYKEESSEQSFSPGSVNNCSVGPIPMGYFNIYFKDMPIEKVIEINNKITGIKCPFSWYKKGEYQMICL
jgi:hypothetical protein